MQSTVARDARLTSVLEVLREVRHPHLMGLSSVHCRGQDLLLDYDQPPACGPGCDGVFGAVAALHGQGLWVGDVIDRLGFDQSGRVVLTGVGSDWDVRDPFAGHPSVRGFDLRIAWRQEGDRRQLADLPPHLLKCASTCSRT